MSVFSNPDLEHLEETHVCSDHHGAHKGNISLAITCLEKART